MDGHAHTSAAPGTAGPGDTWIGRLDRLIRSLERPLVRLLPCGQGPAVHRLAPVLGLFIAVEVLVVLHARVGLGPAAGIGLGHGLLAGGCLWVSQRWADGWVQRWTPAGAPDTWVLPGFRGLAVLLVAIIFLALLPILPLVSHAQALGAIWGALFFIYFCLLFAHQKASQGAMGLLAAARDQSLRARLAPHFLFNTLNSLRAQIDQDPAAAGAMADQLASLYRQLLETADRTRVPLREELAFVEAYLGLERMRLGARLQVRVEVPEELEDLPIPPFSLQVLVENAVKHGVAPLEAGGQVRLAARRDGPALVVTVDDPGRGGAGAPGTGTALATLRQRLGRAGELAMGPEGDHHRVTLTWRDC